MCHFSFVLPCVKCLRQIPFSQFAATALNTVLINLCQFISLVPRPSPSFSSLAVRFTVLQATGSWVRAWEWGYQSKLSRSNSWCQYSLPMNSVCSSLVLSMCACSDKVCVCMCACSDKECVCMCAGSDEVCVYMCACSDKECVCMCACSVKVCVYVYM